MDPDSTLQIASKTDEALEDLIANGRECDAAIDAVARLLANEAPMVAESVRDVSAREGVDRTKAFAEAQRTNFSLREAVGDFTRAADLAQQGVEAVREKAEEVYEGVTDFGKAVIDKAQDVGEAVVDKVQDVGEAAIDKVQDVGEGLHDLGEDMGGRISDAADSLLGRTPAKKTRRLGISKES